MRVYTVIGTVVVVVCHMVEKIIKLECRLSHKSIYMRLFVQVGFVVKPSKEIYCVTGN